MDNATEPVKLICKKYTKEKKGLETTNVKAYELYLRAKYKYQKRKSFEDIEIIRGLINQAINYDNNLIIVKTLLGYTYSEVGDYDKAMGIYNSACTEKAMQIKIDRITFFIFLIIIC